MGSEDALLASAGRLTPEEWNQMLQQQEELVALVQGPVAVALLEELAESIDEVAGTWLSSVVVGRDDAKAIRWALSQVHSVQQEGR